MALGLSFVIASPIPPPKKAEARNALIQLAVKTPVSTKPQALTQPETPQPPVPAPAPAPPPAPAPVVPSGGKYDWMAAAGIAPGDYNAVDYIVTRESGWNYSAVNYLGATGLCQALPGSKMASAGGDYLSNPVTQLRWCSSYAASVYGGWWPAQSFWANNHWW